MSRLRDFLIAPAAASPRPPGEAEHARHAPAHGAQRAGRTLWPRRRPPAAASTVPAIGVLANARDAAVVGAAAGLVVGRGAPAAIVCVHAPGHAALAPALPVPARGRAARLAASLMARGLSADARGRLVLVALPDDPGRAAAEAARARAAASDLPSVLATATREAELDALLRAERAILVALPASADPTLAELALGGAATLAPSTAVALRLGPLQRALALAGLRAPVAIRRRVEEALA